MTGNHARLDPPTGRLAVAEDRALVERHEEELHPDRAKQVQLRGGRSRRVHANHGRGAQAEPRGGQGGVGRAPTETPAARVVLGQVTTG